MAYVREVTAKDGDRRSLPATSAPTASTTRSRATPPDTRSREGRRTSARVDAIRGDWVDPADSDHLQGYVEALLADDRASRGVDADGVPVLPGQALPARLRRTADAADRPLRSSSAGSTTRPQRAVGAVRGEVPRVAAQDLRPRRHRPGHRRSTRARTRAAESGRETETDHHHRAVRRDPRQGPGPLPDDGAARDRDRHALG